MNRDGAILTGYATMAHPSMCMCVCVLIHVFSCKDTDSVKVRVCVCVLGLHTLCGHASRKNIRGYLKGRPLPLAPMEAWMTHLTHTHTHIPRSVPCELKGFVGEVSGADTASSCFHLFHFSLSRGTARLGEEGTHKDNDVCVCVCVCGSGLKTLLGVPI